MRVICVSGKAGHGKDTAASMLKEMLEENGFRVIVTHYADLVKYVCRTFFDWDGKKDRQGRWLLQYVGTDVVRSYDDAFWVSFVSDILYMFRDKWDYAIIPDTRFPNEIELMREVFPDTTHMRVERSNYMSTLTSDAQMHSSETALDDYIAAVYIDNGGSLEDLRANLAVWLDDYLDYRQITFEELLKNELTKED